MDLSSCWKSKGKSAIRMAGLCFPLSASSVLPLPPHQLFSPPLPPPTRKCTVGLPVVSVGGLLSGHPADLKEFQFSVVMPVPPIHTHTPTKPHTTYSNKPARQPLCYAAQGPHGTNELGCFCMCRPFYPSCEKELILGQELLFSPCVNMLKPHLKVEELN